MYVPYNHANFADNQVQPFYSRPVDQMSSSFYQPTAYEAMQPHYSDFYARKVPEITSYSPQLGHQGTRVYVHLQSEHPLDSPLPQYLMFASYRAPTLVTRLEQRGSSYHYVASADAPTFSSTSWVGAQVPLRMHLQDGSGDLGMIDVGIFSYTDGAHHQNRTLSPELHSRKRKTAGDLEEMKMPVKRSSSQQLHSGGIDSHIPNPYSQSESISYSQATQTVPANPSYDGTMPYGRPQVQQGLQDGSTSRRSPLGYYGGPPPDPLPNYASINPSGRSPRLAATSASRISSLSSPSLSANPPLIRTSTLPQTPGLTATPASAASGGPFNPYAMYPRKAVLKLSGDLDSMADRWTPEELLTKRRVVQFWRSQNGSTIDATFEPVAPEDRPPSSICISCILWAERQECFVTSVDTIYLLESLVAVRFTVEEKNRIRRNLEGFHPLTVSKAKSDSESFFKVIMGFGNPKPRNIEKDVKVFPWKILAHALKKIIGKYVSHRRTNDIDHWDHADWRPVCQLRVHSRRSPWRSKQLLWRRRDSRYCRPLH